eukprot:4752936-Prymnesium_polylepis.1
MASANELVRADDLRHLQLLLEAAVDALVTLATATEAHDGQADAWNELTESLERDKLELLCQVADLEVSVEDAERRSAAAASSHACASAAPAEGFSPPAGGAGLGDEELEDSDESVTPEPEECVTSVVDEDKLCRRRLDFEQRVRLVGVDVPASPALPAAEPPSRCACAADAPSAPCAALALATRRSDKTRPAAGAVQVVDAVLHVGGCVLGATIFWAVMEADRACW